MGNPEKLKKLESYKRLINLSIAALCIAGEVACFNYFWMRDFKGSLVEPLRNIYFKGNVLELTIYTIILISFSKMYGGLRLGYKKSAELVFSQLLATTFTNLLIYAELSMMAMQLFVPKCFLILMSWQIALVIIYVIVANKIYLNIFPPRKLLVVYGKHGVDQILEKIATRKDKYTVSKCINVDEGIDKICEEISRGYQDGTYTAVMLWDITDSKRKSILKYCYGNSIRVYTMPKITDVIFSGAEELHVFDSPIMLTREYSLTMEEQFIKRAIDIICSLILLIISSPFMLITAILVKCYDGGPVLYKQVRCTKNMKEFNILKFRSMRVDAEKDGVARLASKGDSRITPVGKFIRKCRLDELPQLVNILKGDMSFIGPRPERPEIIKQYVEVMPEFVFRTKVKAGLAGYAQVYGKYNTSPYDKLKLDLTYIEQYTTWMDIKLMFLTIKILFWPDSTEGVDSTQVTALKEMREEKDKDK